MELRKGSWVCSAPRAITTRSNVPNISSKIQVPGALFRRWARLVTKKRVRTCGNDHCRSLSSIVCFRIKIAVKKLFGQLSDVRKIPEI